MNAYRDEDEDDEWEDDGNDADPGDDSDEEPTVPCPYCRREILEDVPQCPYCEHYISAEDHIAPKKPVWIIATALVCLGIALWWVIAAF
ncbi:MAG: hypothetical protein ACKOSQ_00890 [Planctomycetaceae bacterium]